MSESSKSSKTPIWRGPTLSRPSLGGGPGGLYGGSCGTGIYSRVGGFGDFDERRLSPVRVFQSVYEYSSRPPRFGLFWGSVRSGAENGTSVPQQQRFRVRAAVAAAGASVL